MHNHLLVVIVRFGLIFVVTRRAGQRPQPHRASPMVRRLRAHTQLNVMLLLSNFIVVPALVIGLGSSCPSTPQVKMAFAALALCAGAPFIPWLVEPGQGQPRLRGGATSC